MLDQIKSKLRSLPLDKIVHFLVGMVILSLLYPFGLVLSLVASVVLAFAKEAFDYWSYGGFDLKDLGATILGAILMLVYLAKVVPFLLLL